LALRGKDDKGTPPSELTTDNDLFNTGIVQKDDNQKGGDSLIGRLFSKQHKIDPKAADEGVGELGLVNPNPVQLASATVGQGWPVEVISGEKVYKVFFENKSGDARRVIVGGNSGSRSTNAKSAARNNLQRRNQKSSSGGKSPEVLNSGDKNNNAEGDDGLGLIME